MVTDVYSTALRDLGLDDACVRIGTGGYVPPIAGCAPGIQDYGYPPFLLSILYEPGPSRLAVFIPWEIAPPHIVQYGEETRTIRLVGLGAAALRWRIVETVLRIHDRVTAQVQQVAAELGVTTAELALIDKHTYDHTETDALFDILPASEQPRLPPVTALGGTSHDEGSRLEAFKRHLHAGDGSGAWALLGLGGWSFGAARAAARALLDSGLAPGHVTFALRHWISLERPEGHVTY